MGKLRVGIIGCGGIAYNRHAPGWAKAPDCEIIAAADIVKGNAERMARDFNAKHVFTDHKELLTMDEVDVVSICAPNMYHAPIALDALKAGKHVLCEKPMTTTRAQAEAMVREARKNKRLLMVGQHFRFMHTTQMVKPLLDAGELGKIYYARAHALRRRQCPSNSTFIEKKHAGGGCLYDVGVHILDLTLHLMGFPEPVSVMGTAKTALAHKKDVKGQWGQWDRKKFDVEDFAVGMVKFADGATLTLEASWLLNTVNGESMKSWLYGDKAGLEWPTGVFYTERNGQLIDSTVLEPRRTPPVPHYLEIAALADAIRSGKPSPVPPEESVRVVAILEALYQSSESGREVKIPPFKL